MSDTTVIVTLPPPVEVIVAVNAAAVVEVDRGTMGPPGADGAPGPEGPVGPAATEPYEHIQSVASAVWTITHNFGYYPGGVTLVDSAKRVFMAEVTYVDSIQLVITMTAAQSGFAYVS